MTKQHESPWIEALLRDTAFPHPVEHLQLLQTHISWIVLTGQTAYKIKKPVQFSFVDFSKKEQRDRACQEELRLNRRWNANLYLGLSHVTGTRLQPVIDGSGPVLETAVKMRQFDQNQLLSHALSQGRVNTTHLERFAVRLAAFHQSVAACRTDEFGTPGSIRGPVMANFDEFSEASLGADDLALVERLRAFSDRWFNEHHHLLAQRHHEGFVRECHGDLHLNNMLLLEDEIELFDCLEFNPGFRWCDVMSEIAFLVMDLENSQHFPLARRFLNTYVEVTGDHFGLGVLPFYMSYRAMVRAKVDQLRRRQTGDSTQAGQQLLRDLERYLDEAAAYSREVQPRLAIMAGVSGTGKSHWALELVNQGFVRIRSDFERKRMAGLVTHYSVRESADASDGLQIKPEELYAPESTVKTYESLVRRAEMCLAAGYSVVIDATCLKHDQRQPFWDLADRRGVPAHLFWLEHDPSVLQQRIERRRNSEHDVSDADVDVMARQFAGIEVLADSERARSSFVDGRTTDPRSVIHEWLRQ